jgi:hypothetical protein
LKQKLFLGFFFQKKWLIFEGLAKKVNRRGGLAIVAMRQKPLGSFLRMRGFEDFDSF